MRWEGDEAWSNAETWGWGGGMRLGMGVQAKPRNPGEIL